MSEKEEFHIPTPEEARAAAAEKLKPEVIKLIMENLRLLFEKIRLMTLRTKNS